MQSPWKINFHSMEILLENTKHCHLTKSSAISTISWRMAKWLDLICNVPFFTRSPKMRSIWFIDSVAPLPFIGNPCPPLEVVGVFGYSPYVDRYWIMCLKNIIYWLRHAPTPINLEELLNFTFHNRIRKLHSPSLTISIWCITAAYGHNIHAPTMVLIIIDRVKSWCQQMQCTDQWDIYRRRYSGVEPPSKCFRTHLDDRPLM